MVEVGTVILNITMVIVTMWIVKTLFRNFLRREEKNHPINWCLAIILYIPSLC